METKKFKKTLTGVVVSAKNNKTVTVEVERKFNHPLYKKLVIMHKNYAAHDEHSIAKLGDKVRIRECRPMSKTKHFYVVKVVKKAE